MDNQKLNDQLQLIRAHSEITIKLINDILEELESTPKLKRSKDISPILATMIARRELHFKAGPHQKSIQKKFNLKALPHYTRVLRYLQSNDPREFDGLLRNS